MGSPVSSAPTTAREIFAPCAAAALYQRQALREVGGFDEDFFAHMEEIDLCWKLNRAGYSVFYQGTSTVYHVGGGTLSATNPQKTYLNFRNGLSLIFKHNHQRQLLWKLPVRILLDWVAVFKFLIEGAGASGIAVIKAHVNFLLSINREIKKRKLLKEQIPGFEVNNTYRGLIIFDFYFRNRKNFRDLKM